MKPRAPRLALAGFAAAGVAWAEPPRVLVTTVAPHRGAIDRTIDAWGTARSALDASTTLSVQVDGAVNAILVTPGEAVAKGQRLIDIRPSANSANLFQQATNALAAARTGASRTAALLAHHLATRDALAQAERAVADSVANLDALRREGAGQTMIAVRAPFDGIVDTIPISRGTRLPAGTPLATLTALGGLVATVGIEPADLPIVRPGDAATIAPLDRAGPNVSGQVIRIDATIDPRTRLVDADVSVPRGAVLAGEAVAATLKVGSASGWIVPHASVLADANGTAVFQVARGRAHRVGVNVALVSGDRDVVTGAIDPSRPVVVDGSYQLTDNAPVRTGP